MQGSSFPYCIAFAYDQRDVRGTASRGTVEGVATAPCVSSFAALSFHLPFAALCSVRGVPGILGIRSKSVQVICSLR